MRGRRFLLVVNPRGGVRRGLTLADQAQARLAEAGSTVDVHVSQYPGHAAELARTLDLGGYDGLCLVGGDGTIHEVVNGLLQRTVGSRIPLGLIPGGTGNSVLLHLGCTTAEDAIQRILAGRTQDVDAARLTCRDQTVYCVNIVGWGGVVDINRTAERWRWLGRPRYTLATLWNILWPIRRRARLVLDGQVLEDEFVFVLGCNTRFTGKAMDVAPRAELADGRLDVVFVRRASRRQMLQLFQGVYDGTFATRPGVEYRQVRSLAIETKTPELLNLDGELKSCACLSAEVVPGAVSVFA